MQEQHPIIDILNRWPSRQAIADDVNEYQPKSKQIDLVAVHRWHQRKRIPSKYDLALIEGASRRNIALNWRELMTARSAVPDQNGHAAALGQGQSQILQPDGER